MQHWQSLGFQGTGTASFVDNLLAAADNVASAIRIQDDCAQQLQRRWNLQIGDDSQEYLICRNGADNVTSEHKWTRRCSMKTLGHIIDDDGGIDTCFKEGNRFGYVACLLRQS